MLKTNTQKNLTNQQELRTSEIRYRRLFETACDGILILDPKTGIITDVSPYMTKLLGYTREEFIGKKLREIGLLEDEEASILALRELQNDEYIRYEDLPLKTQNGQRRDVEFVSTIYAENDRRVIQCNIRDITEHKALEKNTYNLAAIVESSNEAIISKSFDGTILTWNKAAELIFGYCEEEIVGKNISILSPPEYLAQSVEIIEKIRRGESIQDFETTRLKKDGSIIPIFLSLSPIKTATGETIAISKIAHDISDRKHSEKALEESAQRERAMIENALDVICTIDAEGKFVSVNPACFKVWGYYPEQLIGQFYIDYVAREDVNRTNQTALKIKSGIEMTNFENRYRHNDGSFIDVRWATVWSEADQLMFCIAHDITATKKLERQLRQAQKLESVGLLAAGIAHDFNNMLTAINGYSDLILRKLTEDDPLRGNIMQIKKAGLRSADLTHQLLAFSHQQVLQPLTINLNEIIADTITMLQRVIGENIQLATALNPKIGLVKVDPGQFTQIIMNLAVNARDSMSRGGKLTIETTSIFLDTNYIHRNNDIPSGNYVLMAVSDTGTGMDSETLERIFEPFFTTKELGQGTGLGLATVYGIVKQSGGSIEVYSEKGIGTTFKIYLPVVIADRNIIAAAETSPEMITGTETILLAEDEELVRDLTKDVLETCGYTVIEVSNGLEALGIYEKGNYKFDLLITDLVMPKLGGRELATELLKKLPNLSILFTSGYTDDAVVRHGVIEANTNFIQKPFTPEAIAGKVRKILDNKLQGKKK